MKISIRAITLLAAALIVSAFAAYAAAGGKFEPISTGTMGSGDAVIELTPSVREDGKLIVKFAANTHTVDLAQYDLAEAATLEVNGETITPEQADRLRGHHAYGKIKFNVGREIDSFRIRIVGIPADEERIYEW